MPHYYSEKQTSRIDQKKIKVESFGRSIELFSGSGVFSKDKLDCGSKILIENCIIKPGWDILDLGCGIGVVGILLMLNYPGLKAVLSDVNERAVMLAKKNVKLHRIEHITVKKSFLFEEIPEKFDSILFNPPQTAGKDLCFEAIEKSKEHLKKGGLLQLVARHNKGGKSLMDKMESIFSNAEDIAKQSGYRVYISKYL